MHLRPTFHDGLLLSGARGFSVIAFVATTALLSRTLTPADYGAFRQSWTLYLVAVPVLAAGLAQSVFYFVPLIGTTRDAWLLVRRTIAMAGLLGTFVALCLALGSRTMARSFGDVENAPVFLSFAVFLGASVPTQLSDAVFLSVGRARTAALFNLLNRSTLLVGLAVPIIALRLPLENSLVILGAVQLLVVGGIWVLARSAHHSSDLCGATVPVKAQWNYAFPCMGASAFGALFNQADKLVVAWLTTPAVFAVYANGAFENPVVALVVPAAWGLVASELVRRNATEGTVAFADLWATTTKRVAQVLLPVGAFLFAFAPEVVALLFSTAYADSAKVFRVYMLLTPVRVIAFSTLFASMNRNAVYLAGHVIVSIVVLIAAPLLLKVLGLVGPAVALVAASYGLAAGFLWMAAAGLRVPVRRLLPCGAIASSFGISVVAALAARQIVDSARPVSGTVALAVGAAAFCMVVVGGEGASRILSRRRATASPVTAPGE